MYSIRPFQPADLNVYRNMRLEALLTEPGNFGNSYTMEVALTEEEWVNRICNPLGCRFGLYKDELLIGITGIIANQANPQEAYMTQSYITRAYRGKGLSRMLYVARIEWARANDIKCLIIGHRACNTISRNANQRFGFVYTHQELKEWPDGGLEPMLYYRLFL